MCLISVIIPVYNTKKYLENCVTSVLNQNFDNYEVILIDDGSTDGTSEICDKFTKIDARVKVIHKKNGGVSSARNSGIEIAEGDYIWFVDSDDTVASDALRVLSEYIKENPDLVVFNCSMHEDYLLDSLDDFFREHYFSYHLGFAPWNKLYKKELLELSHIRFDTEEKIGEDLLFNVTYYQRVKTIRFVGTKLYNYVVRENSAMTTIDDQRYLKQMRLFDKIRDMISDKVSRETIMCLYFMHLVSGINQTSNNQLGIKERKKIVQGYFQKYSWNKTDYYNGLKQFFRNENASVLGKIKAYLLYRIN